MPAYQFMSVTRIALSHPVYCFLALLFIIIGLERAIDVFLQRKRIKDKTFWDLY